MSTFESNANVAGANPEGDLKIWTMDVDGANAAQVTHNALHDEGPAWSPDGTMLAYSSGADDLHLDINVMTTGGMHVRRLTDYEGGDESPDWQAIPAPRTKRRCGDVSAFGALARDVRASGRGLSCVKAFWLPRGGCASALRARARTGSGSSRSCTSRDGGAARYAGGGA
jgi:hypothetical protein